MTEQSLPSTWQILEFSDVYDVRDGTHDSPKYHDKGFPLITSKNLKNGEINFHKVKYISKDDYEQIIKRSHVEKQDVLFAMIGTIGNPVVVEYAPDFAIKNVALFKVPEHQNSYFLKYYLESPFVANKMQSEAKGSTQKFVGLRYLRSFPVTLPPLAEQKRIVAILDEAFAGIDQAIANTERNLANARELFDSYLNEVFKREGNGFTKKTLGVIGKVSMCKRILKKQTTPSGDIPFYKIGTFGKQPDAFISSEIYQDFRERYSFPKKGDILLSASGTIGRRVVYDGMPAYFQDSNIVWLDNDETMVLNQYLYYFYGACDWKPSKGATISRLYNDDLRKMAISFPNIDEQRKLIGMMTELESEISSIESCYQRKLEALGELKQSLLQKAFTGELTADWRKQHSTTNAL